MPALQPDDGTEIDRTNTSKLVRGMLFFVLALVLMGVVFFGLWLWMGDHDTQSSASPKHQNAAELKQTVTSTPPHQETTNKRAPPLQGPDEGLVVAPPTRDVTPNYQLSPLHQAKPLTRAAGNPLPPPPKREPLPQIFRKVIVEGPTELELGVGRNRIIPIKLAYLQPPRKSEMCWFAGQNAPCAALGKTALRRFIRRRAVGCDWISDSATQENSSDASGISSGNDTGRQVARCYLGTGLKARKAGEEPKGVTDIGSWLVRFGWAEPLDGFYGDERQEAIGLKRGIHSTQDSSGGANALARQEEMRTLSRTNEQAADRIAASATQDLDGSADALTLMSPPVIEKEKEPQLPPGFE